jgi:NADH:ubiquinone oxidoreductase subunit D
LSFLTILYRELNVKRRPLQVAVSSSAVRSSGWEWGFRDRQPRNLYDTLDIRESMAMM